MMHFNNKKVVTAMAVALIVVGGGGLISAKQAYVKDKADKSMAVSVDRKSLKDVYVKMAADALKTKEAKSAMSFASMRVGEEKEVVLTEDFSGFPDGSEDEYGVAVSTYFEDGNSAIDDSKTSTSGWWGIGVYEAGGAVALAHPGFGGVITSSPMEMYGNLHVSMKVKAYHTNKDESKVPFIVSVIYGDSYSPVLACQYQIVNITKEEGWQEIELNFQNPVKQLDCRVQINAAFYTDGIVVDDLKVTRDYDFCLMPQAVGYYGFDMDGFTAYWEPGAENNYYLISLRQEKEVDNENVVVAEGFENINMAEGVISNEDTGLPGTWTMDLGDNPVVSNEGFDGSTGIVFDGEDFIEIDGKGGRFYEFSFFVNPSVSAESYTIIELYGWTGTEYEWFADVSLKNVEEDGEFVDIFGVAKKMCYKYSKIKLTGVYFGDGEYCVIDDVKYATTPVLDVKTMFTDRHCDEPELRIDGLDPEAEYYFSVTGVKNDEFRSEPTPFIHALGLPAPQVADPSDIEKRGSYTANWNSAPKAVSYMVNNYERRIASEDVPGNILIHDTFANATQEFGYLEGTSFDGIADNKGWASNNGLVDSGRIGAFMVPLYTPELSLGNNGGKFTVRFKVTAFGDEIVAVSSCQSQQIVDFWELNPDGDPYSMVTHELSFEFEDGHEHQRLAIAGLGYGTILIEDFEVVQDLKSGDEIYTFAGSEVTDASTLSTRFTGLYNRSDLTYAYNVRAIGSYFGEEYISDYSIDKIVDFNTVGVESVEDLSESAIMVVSVVEGGIVVTITDDADIAVFSIVGETVACVDGKVGQNFIPLAKGVYIVSTSMGKAKLMVMK